LSILPPIGPGSGNTLPLPQGLTVHVKLCHKFLIVFFGDTWQVLTSQKRELKNLFCFPCFEKEQKKLPSGSLALWRNSILLLTCHEATLEKQEQAGPQDPPGTSYGQLILLGSSPGKLWPAYPARFFTRQV